MITMIMSKNIGLLTFIDVMSQLAVIGNSLPTVSKLILVPTETCGVSYEVGEGVGTELPEMKCRPVQDEQVIQIQDTAKLCMCCPAKLLTSLSLPVLK